MTNPAFLRLLQGSGEAFLLEYLPTCPRHRLLQAHKAFGLPDCNCEPEILPCEKHAQFEEWHAEGYSAAEIARMWRCNRRERVDPDDITKYFETADAKRECDCSLMARIIPCSHVSDQAFVLPFSCQLLLLELLDLEDYREPPAPMEEPFDNLDATAQVERMAERVGDLMSPFLPADTFSLFHRGLRDEKITREAHHGSNGQASGPAGVSLAGDFFVDGRKPA